MVVETAVGVMICAVLAQHMGLTEALARLALKVAKCPKCCTFWSSLIVLTYETGDAIISLALSLLMAYIAMWAGFALMWLNIIYNKIWERLMTRR